MARRFMQVDVFDSGPFTGNPLAVVLDADGLTATDMQRITDWTNLSEAAFLFPPTEPSADYRIRIFCPGRELPFAGHPTLGSAHAWLAAGGQPKDPAVIVQECGAGSISIRRDDDLLAFAAPPLLRSGPIDPELLARRIRQLGLRASDVVDSAWIDNGPGWMGLLLESADAVLAVDAPAETITGFDVGLVGPHVDGHEFAIEVRGFFADAAGAVREDPVTGSLHASVAQWLTASGRVDAPYTASQGRVLGRAGQVHVGRRQDQIWVGGHSTVVVDGTIDA